MRQRTVDIGEPNVSTYSDDALRKLREHPDASEFLAFVAEGRKKAGK
jgi:hypothetical protein